MGFKPGSTVGTEPTDEQRAYGRLVEAHEALTMRRNELLDADPTCKVTSDTRYHTLRQRYYKAEAAWKAVTA